MPLDPIEDRLAHFPETIEIRTAVNEYPRAINEASDGLHPRRGATVSGRLFLPEPPKRPSLLGCLGLLAHYASSSDGGRAIELLGEVVT